jgi:predicted nuclease of predicted toxin-antitoxin system
VKLLVDANLSPKVASRLGEAGHDAVHVSDVGLLSASDPQILQAADDQDRVVLTADADFGALLALGSLATPSVMLLRSADHMRPVEQADLVIANLPVIAESLDKGAIVSFTRDRLRVRSLPIAAKPDEN